MFVFLLFSFWPERKCRSREPKGAERLDVSDSPAITASLMWRLAVDVLPKTIIYMRDLFLSGGEEKLEHKGGFFRFLKSFANTFGAAGRKISAHSSLPKNYISRKPPVAS